MNFYEWTEGIGEALLSEQEKERLLRRTLEKAGLTKQESADGKIGLVEQESVDGRAGMSEPELADGKTGLIKPESVDNKTELTKWEMEDEKDGMMKSESEHGESLDWAVKRKKQSGRSFGAGLGRKRWLLAAVCFLVITLGTVSFAGIALDKNFLDLFRPQNDQQLSSLSQMGTAINQSIEDNGSVLTVGQAVSDGHTVYVAMDFTAPEGTVLDAPYYHFQDIWIHFPGLGNMPCGYYMESLDDENTEDNKISFILQFDGEKNLRGETMQISLKGLKTMKSQEELDAVKSLPPMTEPGTPGDAYDWEKVVIDGAWEVEFQLSDQNSAVTFRPNEAVSLFGGKCKIKKVEISPISITIEVKGDAILDYDSVPPDALETEDDTLAVSILMKDGSQVEFNGGSQGISRKTMTVTKNFNQIIDPAQIASVTLAGTTLTF